MKKNRSINIIACSVIFLLGLMAVQSCKKEITESNLGFRELAPAILDTNAGSWKTILGGSPQDLTVNAPGATTSPDYIIQLNEIKSYQSNLSAKDRDIVKYWAAGAVLRWNEIMRELVAKHNVAPEANPDGTYPVPSAANPLAYPQFPFSNPPYAARAYAYVSAAQYDALVATAYYKQMYPRAAPYKIDAGVTALIPKSGLSSYPSEDGAVEGAAVAMLRMLFPGDQGYIDAKAEEHKRARLMAGANVRSDLDAGEAIGKAAAQKFIARARGDRAGSAVGTPDIWKKLVTDCEARGEVAWVSQETPARPPMLPMFGRVKPFLFDSATMVSEIRPGPPPSTSSAQFAKELNEIYTFSKNLTRDQDRIVQFWADGVATYTPPGHWNAIAAEDFVKQNYSEVRWARNLALLNMSLMDAAIVCWDAKYTYFNPRPSQMNPAIKTSTGLPNFPSYISGHSTFSGAAAEILGHILPERKSAYDAMTQEASISRMYGAIHYRSDCEMGLVAGRKVGDHAIARAMVDGAE